MKDNQRKKIKIDDDKLYIIIIEYKVTVHD